MRVDYVCGPIRVSPASRVVSAHGQPVALGARAFDLLLALLERRDRVVDKQELLALVWPRLVVEEGNLSVQISALRKVLGNHAITTVPGRGYRFTATVVEQLADAAAMATPAPADDAAAILPGRLPTALTPLLGRADALAQARQHLQHSRCLTLTGAGGAGKTRLALALAEAVREQYPGGVWWVGLDALSDPALLAQALAAALGGTATQASAMQTVAQRLAGRASLVVLDNCEHLIEACAELCAGLLAQLPQLHLLCTSRESLRIAGETVWPVPTLAVPQADEARPEQVGQHASVQLLVQRIAQHAPGFALDKDNAAALAHICRGLDGLPLALELVAAQVGLRSPAQVAARLDRSLALLNVGPRGGMRHHQTMAAATDWGYRLLGQTEQALFIRLAVLLGGWTLEGAEAVCADLGLGEDQLPDLMGSLLRASMVLALPLRPGAVQRFRMLEPIRQFAMAQLEEQGLVDAVKQQALAWYQRRGQGLAAQLSGPEQALGYAYLVSEFDNLRALLSWSKGHDLAGGLQLAADLWRFWQAKGHAKEMLAWFDETLPLAQAQALPERLRAEASNTAGNMARTCGRYDRAHALYQSSWALQRGLGNRRGEAVALNNLCLIARDQYKHEAVLAQGGEGLAIAREIGDRNLEGLALMHLGTAFRGLNRTAEAQAHFEQSLTLFKAMGEKRAQATLLNFLGNLALAEGRPDEAEQCFQQGLLLNEELQELWGLGISHCNLAALHLAREEDGQALQHALRSLKHFRLAGARHGAEECFDVLARLARRRGQWAHAAWCWGVVEQLEHDMGKHPSPSRQAQRGHEFDLLTGALSPAACRAAHGEGLQTPLEAALAAALAEGLANQPGA